MCFCVPEGVGRKWIRKIIDGAAIVNCSIAITAAYLIVTGATGLDGK